MKIIRYLDAQGKMQLGEKKTSREIERLEGELFSALRPTGELAVVTKILAPVVPVAILGIGLNYKRHAAETGSKTPEYPILFSKGINTLQHPGDPIEIPTRLASEEVDYECELAVVIGKTCKNVKCENALDYVLGYTCANDVSARDWQIKRGGVSGAAANFLTPFARWGLVW